MDLIVDLQWRLDLEPDVRPRQIDRIFLTLIFSFPNCASMDLNELKNMADWLEEESFIAAKSYIEYLDRIYVRVQNMEKRFPTTDVFQMPNPGQQLLSQNAIVSDGAKRSASLSHALPSMPSTLTRTSVPNVAAGLKMQSGIAKNKSSQDTIVSDGAKRSASLSPALPSMTSTRTRTSVPNVAAGLKMQSGIAKNKSSQDTIVSDGAKRSASLSPALPSVTSTLTQTSVPNVAAGLKMQFGIAKNKSSQDTIVSDGAKRSASLSPALHSMTSTRTRTSVPNVAAGLKMQSGIAKNKSSQDTIVSDGAKRSASLSPALPSMPSLTRTSVPNVAGLKMQSGIAKKQFSSQKQKLMRQNLLQATQMSNDVGRSSTKTQSKTAQAQDLFQKQQEQQLMKQNKLQPTQMSNVVGRSINTQSEIAHTQDLFQQKKQQHQLMNPQLFSSSHGMQSQMHNQGQQLLSQNPIVSDGAKRSASLSPALPSVTSPTQTSVPNVVAGLKVQSGIAKKQLSSRKQQLMKQNLLQPTQMSNNVGRRSTKTQSETAHAQDLFQKQQIMKQNKLQPTQMSNVVGRSSTKTQSETAHAQDLFQKQQLMKQNKLQPTQMSNVVGRSSTKTQSEIAHAQDLFQQKQQQHQLMNPQLFSSSMNSSNAQTGKKADDWREKVYQEMQAIKQRRLPHLIHLRDIYQKTTKECQHLKRNDSVLNVPQCERQKLVLLAELEGHMGFLNLSKDRVLPSMKGNLSKYEKHLIHVIESNWPLEPVSAQHQIQQPGGHPLSAQPQQQRQEEVDNATNQMQPRKS